MEIKKFRHACLTLTKDNQSIIVDPGSWSADLILPPSVVGVIITHEHSDHFDQSQLQKIFEVNPNAIIFAHKSVISQIANPAIRKHAVSAGDTFTCGKFELNFNGGQHATIHPGYPVPANLGVTVDNGKLYYPGDSFSAPDCKVETLAVPASAPWMKTSEAMDFIVLIKPKLCFSTHNAILSREGQQLADNWLARAAESVGAEYISLDPSESILV